MMMLGRDYVTFLRRQKGDYFILRDSAGKLDIEVLILSRHTALTMFTIDANSCTLMILDNKSEASNYADY